MSYIAKRWFYFLMKYSMTNLLMRSFATSFPCKLLTFCWDGHGNITRRPLMMAIPTNTPSCTTTRRWHLFLSHLSRCMKTNCDCNRSMNENWLRSQPILKQSLRHRSRGHLPMVHLVEWRNGPTCLPRTGKFVSYFCLSKLSICYIVKRWFYFPMRHSLTYLLKFLLCCRNLRTFSQTRLQVDYPHLEGSSTR